MADPDSDCSLKGPHPSGSRVATSSKDSTRSPLDGTDHNNQILEEDAISSKDSDMSVRPLDGSNCDNQHLQEDSATTSAHLIHRSPQHTQHAPERSGRLERHHVAKARPPREKPPWVPDNNQAPPPLSKLPLLNEQPFRYRDNIVYLLPTDGNLNTEVLQALLERNYIAAEEFSDKHFCIGEIHLSQIKDIITIGIFVKDHIDDKPLRSNLRKCLTTLKNLVKSKRIKSLAIARDIAILSVTEWAYFTSLFESLFAKYPVSAVLLQNNLPVPATEDRFQVIKEYHEASIGGHRGINKTFSKIAEDFYWRHMRHDVKQFVSRCATCQTKKLVRQKTKLPMVISNTPALPFEQLALDFYGPLQETNRGFRYILSAQDMLTKYIILTPVKRATAIEVTRALTEKVICYFGPPAAILSDQGTHFRNRLLDAPSFFKSTNTPRPHTIRNQMVQ